MSLLCLGKYFRHVVFVLIFALITIGILSQAPNKAEAVIGCPTIPVTPIANPISVPTADLGVVSVLGGISVQTGGNYAKECWLDSLGKALAKAVINELTTSVINWINNGFEGGPTFVTDPAGFFADIADQEFGRFIDGSALGFLCDPFRFQIQLGFLAQRNRYRTPSRCTITGIINNFENFTNGDFDEGGWTGWVSMTTVPVNSAHGSRFISEELLTARVSARQNNANITLGWGNGFKSILGRDGKITTPGSLIDDQLKQTGSSFWRDLELGREFDDIIIALVNAGLTQIMNNGVRR